MANLVPKVNNTGSIGTNAKKWSNVHTTTLTLGAQNAPLSLNSQKITNLSDPASASDAATKSYVDNAIQGLSAKDSVRLATDAPGTLATSFANGQQVDGVNLATGDRILIKDQTAGAENGIYTVNASGAPTRAGDFDSNDQVEKGAYIFVEEGTENANAGFVLTTDGAITLGTTALSFTQFSGAGQITAGSGITKSGNTLSADISGLSAIASMAASDVLMIADVDDNNNLKKITRANFIADITSEVIDDSSPQLGGDLDVQTHKIVSTSDRDITLAPHGTGDVFVEDAYVKFNPYGGLSFNSNNISDPGLTVVHYEDGFNPTRSYQGLGISSTGNNNAYPMLSLTSTSPVDNSGNASTTGPILRLHNRQNSSNGEITGAIYFGSGNSSFTQPCSISAIYDTASGSRASSISLTHYVAGSFKSVLVKNNSLIVDNLATFGVGTIDLKNDGSAVSSIKLYCQSGNSHYTQIQSALHAAYGGGGNVTLTLPTATGTLLSSGDTGTVTNTMLAGSIAASKLNGEIFADLETLGAPSSDGEFIVATGAGAFAYESGTTVRTSLGLGSGDNVSFASLSLSGQAAPLAMNTQKITGLGAPQAAADAATKAYVDQVAQGLDVKDSVVAATTASFAASTVGTTDTITLSNGEGGFSTAGGGSLTIDGVSITQGDRILIKDGVNENNSGVSQAKNGIYTVGPLGGPLCSLTRSSDMDSTSGVTAGSFCFVEQGNTNADIGFVITTDGSITIGTTAITFAQFSGAGSVTAGAALTKTGNTLDVAVNSSGGLEINNDELRVKAAGITSAMLAGSIANSKLNQLTTANKVALSSLDLDGGTDIGADLVDADLIVVDDGAGGTNRKSTLSRIKKYIFSSVSGDASANDSGAFTVASSGVAADDITAGNSAVDISTNSGNLVINNSGLGQFTLKHTNTSGNSIDVLNFNRGQNGLAEFYAPIQTCVTQTGTNILGGLNTEITGHLYPGSNNNRTLGKAANTWSDLYLGDSSILYFGNDQEIKLEHDPDDGLILKMVGASSYDPSFTLLSDNASSVGSILRFRHDSSSPAVNDYVGFIDFAGNQTGGSGASSNYGRIVCQVADPAAGSNNQAGKMSIVAYPASFSTACLQVEGISGQTSKVKVNVKGHNGTDSGLHLDGTLVTASAAELNLLDGATTAVSTTLVDADRVIVNDAGTMKQVALSDVKTYVNAGGSSADFSSVGENILPSAANTYSLGSASAEWSDLYLGDASKIYFGNDQDVYLEHDPDDGVQLHMATAGAIEPTFKIVHNNINTNYNGPSIQLVNNTQDNTTDLTGSFRFMNGSTLNSFIYSSGLGGNSGTGSKIYFGICKSGATASTALTIDGVGLASGSIVQIHDHNGSNAGLKLGNVLVTATAAELNKLDGVTATTAEINLLDGATNATSTTLQNTDRVIVNDAGVMKQVALSDVKTYVGSGTFEAQAIEFGDLLLNYSGGSSAQYLRLTMADNSSEGEPIFLIENDTASTSGGKLSFSIKEANDNFVGDGDTLGIIEWRETQSNGGTAFWCHQVGKVLDHTNNYGSLELKVRSGSTSPATALSIEGSAGGTLVDIEDHDGTDSGLKLGGTLVTSTAAELNSLDVSAQSPSDNEVLTYTAASGLHWAAAGGGGGGSATIPDVQVVTADTSAAFASSGSNGDNERIYLVNNGANARTITLPAVSGNTGKKFQIKRLGTANVTIAVQSNEYLEGTQNGTFVLSSQYSSVTIVGNASGTSDGWYII